jgi:hypothetical protein
MSKFSNLKKIRNIFLKEIKESDGRILGNISFVEMG